VNATAGQPAEADRADGLSREAWAASARVAIRRALDEPAPDRGIAHVQIEAPRVAIDAALAALRAAAGDEAPWILLDPPSGIAIAGAGEAARLDAGADLGALRDRTAALLHDVVESGAAVAPTARLVGGLAFDRDRAPGGPSGAFGAGHLVLPLLRYARGGERAWLSCALPRPGRDRERAASAFAAAADGIARTDARTDGESDLASPPRALRVDPLGRAAWSALVSAMLAAIRDGAFEKLVAARRTDVEAEAAIDVAATLARLGAAARGCTRFALADGGACFFGATPERLVARQGAVVLTEALAGTASLEDGAAALAASAKDAVEHALVVREIARRLAPLCAHLHAASAPSVRTLPGLLHLHTPIAGRLREPVHVLDLVAALHPTPAVAGLPCEAAARFIAAHEPSSRGWYAGPFGWLDAAGDGEFVVALRSAVVRGRRAWLWSGAGIVEGSEPDAEYRETELKQRPMLAALAGIR
jgi:isochorismate synthase